MKKILLFLWQLPQNILGLLVILFTKAKYCNKGCWVTTVGIFGVSLGKYIIFGQVVNDTSLKHEQGHQKQSLHLGWLYLLVIGIPSFLGNIWDRVVHRNWMICERKKWYYNQPWEKWADELGNVNRFNSGV